jgi:hypothetical protein
LMLAIEIHNVSGADPTASDRSRSVHTPANKCLASFVWGRKQDMCKPNILSVCIRMLAFPYVVRNASSVND